MKQDLNGVRTPEDVVRRYDFEDIPVLVKSTKEIALEVGKKVNGDEVISAINLSPEEAKIRGNKISLEGQIIDLTANNIQIKSDQFKVDSDGNIIANSGNFGGWELNKDGLTNGEEFIHNNGYSNIYTYADMVILRNYLLGRIDLSENDISHYDLNNDGVVDSADLALMRKKILGIDEEEND